MAYLGDNIVSVPFGHKREELTVDQRSIESDILSLVSKNERDDRDKLSLYDHLRITKEKDIPQPDPTITKGLGQNIDRNHVYT